MIRVVSKEKIYREIPLSAFDAKIEDYVGLPPMKTANYDENNYSNRSIRHQMTADEKKEIVQAYKDGSTVVELSDSFNRTQKTIRTLLKRRGVELVDMRKKENK